MSRLEGGCGSQFYAFGCCGTSGLEKEHQDMASLVVLTIGLDTAWAFSVPVRFGLYLEFYHCRSKPGPAGETCARRGS